MLVERSIDASECDGFGCVRFGRFGEDGLERERVQAKASAFFGEEHVVQVAK